MSSEATCQVTAFGTKKTHHVINAVNFALQTASSRERLLTCNAAQFEGFRDQGGWFLADSVGVN